MDSFTVAQVVSTVIEKLGATPILLFFTIIFIVPWASFVWSSYKMNRAMNTISSDWDKRMSEVFRRQDTRFEQVVRMYEDNVSLVKSYEMLVANHHEANDKLIELVSVSTGTQQTLVEYIKNNWWCPVSKDPSLIKRLQRGPVE